MMDYDSYVHLIRQLDDLIAIFEQHPDDATREQVMALLSGIDLLHREGLQRLVGAMRTTGGEAALATACADPVVETLLGLYDLVDLNLPEEPAPLPEGTSFIPLGSLAAQRGGRVTGRD